jgi:4a-hydroxytetrahydrobiopterin dehydratase
MSTWTPLETIKTTPTKKQATVPSAQAAPTVARRRFFTSGRSSTSGKSESTYAGDVTEALSRATCVACRRGAPTVTDEEIAALAPEVPDWELVEIDGVRRLRRVFSFDDFAQALAFTDAVGAVAEEQGHHPALLTEWGRTTVSWWTHKIKGLHRNDFIMAAKTDELYQSVGR